ncbi:MAG: cobyrinate a,c-diamide synthase [Pseudomonadota bacterium]
MKAILIAAPTSGAGKTTVTLGLLRALTQDGHRPRSLKLGPDYIDAAFHEAATGQDAFNLDPWAMDHGLQRALLAGPGPLVIESAMGLFDGAGLAGKGSAAEVARRFDLPILLVIDCAKSAQTLPALVEGVVNHETGLRFHGLVLNNVGSDRHAQLLTAAFQRSNVPPIRAILPRAPGLTLPSRHLGLVQAREHPDLASKLDEMAAWLRAAVSPETLLAEAPDTDNKQLILPPPAQSIAVARDAAFTFAYPHLLNAWQSAGATLHVFSPLANEEVPKADLIYLPGGYPELYAAELSGANKFIKSLRMRSKYTDIYGECGGYMALGKSLIDVDDNSFPMANLLDVTTSFKDRKMTLGYRNVTTAHGPFQGTWAAHEFHYSTPLEESGEPLFQAEDADGTPLAPMGLRKGRVSGSYAHLIAPRS